MRRPRITGTALAVLALCACRNPELEKKAQEAAAVEKQLAEAKAAREGLERERARLSQQLAEVRARTDATRRAYHHTLAAASYLAAVEGSELRPSVLLHADMSAARSGFLLEEATRDKDSAALHALATGLLDSERPCVETKKEEASEAQAGSEAHAESECGPCEAEPYEDACVGVPEHLSQWPAWTCDTLTASGNGLPTAAFCRATFEYPKATSSGSSEHAMDGLPTSQEVVRVVFEHGGRLYASDFPDSSDELYHPPNSTGLAECAASTEQRSCAHQCDLQFDRYEDPCACNPSGMDASDAYDPESEFGEDGEEPEESYEVRQARLAAEAAEAEAARAQREAEEAAQELKYQECIAACVPEQSATTEGDSSERDRVVRTTRLEVSPAPGVFVVTVDTRIVGVDGKDIRRTSATSVLVHEALQALWMEEPLPDADRLSSLLEYEAFEDVLRQDGKVSLAPPPGMQGATLVGLSQGKVKAFRFSSGSEEMPLEALAPAAVCEALKKEPQRFPGVYLATCDTQPEPATAAPAAGDAGTEDKVAGEVTP